MSNEDLPMDNTTKSEDNSSKVKEEKVDQDNLFPGTVGEHSPFYKNRTELYHELFDEIMRIIENLPKDKYNKFKTMIEEYNKALIEGSLSDAQEKLDIILVETLKMQTPEVLERLVKIVLMYLASLPPAIRENEVKMGLQRILALETTKATLEPISTTPPESGKIISADKSEEVKVEVESDKESKQKPASFLLDVLAESIKKSNVNLPEFINMVYDSFNKIDEMQRKSEERALKERETNPSRLFAEIELDAQIRLDKLNTEIKEEMFDIWKKLSLIDTSGVKRGRTVLERKRKRLMKTLENTIRHGYLHPSPLRVTRIAKLK
jgi:hypothetical protein